MKPRTWLGAGLLILAANCMPGSVARYGPPPYSSTAIVRIYFTPVCDIGATDERRSATELAYARSQRALIAGEQMTQRAKVDPVWRNLGVAAPKDATRYYASHMVVSFHPQGSNEFISLSIAESSQARATAAATAIANACLSIDDEATRRLDESRLAQLDENLVEMRKRHADLILEREELKQPGSSSEKMDKVKTDLDTVNLAINDITSRMDILRDDFSLGSRVSVFRVDP